MPTSRLVTSDDWPEPELRAAVLAGELVAVGPCWASPAEPQVPSLRAAAFAWRVRDRRVVASGRTAAWVWGACSSPPEPLQVSIPPRVRIRLDPDVQLREVRLDPGDVEVLDGVAVTSPVRTALDLLRTPGAADPAALEGVQGVLVTGAVDADVLAQRLAALGTVPMVRQAERRLAALRDGRVGPS